MKNIITFGLIQEGAMEQAKRCLDEAEAFALMADNHKGYGMPVGGVAVYKNKISPAGVGFDIACGNKAVKLDIYYEEIKDKLPEIAKQISKQLSFGVGQKNNTKVEHKLFDSPTWDLEIFKQYPDLKKKAQSQLGTIGSGNHYIDVFRDKNGFVWIGVHFGSRGLGHTIASHFMKLAGDNPNIIDETPHCLRYGTKEFKDYVDCMELAGDYAYAGRDWVCETVAKIIGGEIIQEVHNHHNFAWLENHNGVDYWVVRKGATPAFPDQLGFIGGSMGDNAVIVRGVDSEKSKEAFYSTVHGAGRVMSRTQAVGRTKSSNVYKCGMRGCDGFEPYRDLKQDELKPKCPKCGAKTNKFRMQTQIKEGLVNMEEVRKNLKEKGIILIGAGGDEAPEVYKKLPEVLELHKGTIEILEVLEPLIVVMAGGNEYDPYKD